MSPRSTSPCPAITRRARGLIAAGLLAMTAVLGAGCYETPKPACAFACARDGSCPEGYACDTQDQICHRVLAGGELEACDQPFLDAATIDASVPIDASPIDAPIDAAVDAPPDA